MDELKVIFWFSFGIIFYTYIGYGIVLCLLVPIKRAFFKNNKSDSGNSELPEVTLLIPAYNEKDYVNKKLQNTKDLKYPKDKLHVIWVTDGSDDGTNVYLQKQKNISLYHENERKGKINALNRVMPFVKTPFVIFTDANTELCENAILLIVEAFNDIKVGCVSGEKRIINKEIDQAAGTGEGLYWKYESFLKQLDSELYTAVGAVGELFAIRTELYREVEPDTILDDFIISLRIAQQGFVIKYQPNAFAIEAPSANVKEELKRKIRISAGGIQSVIRLLPLLNIFKYGLLSFQYISHRVLRWTITPILLFALIPISLGLAYLHGFSSFGFYNIFFWLQMILYLVVILGWCINDYRTRFKLVFVPYYFFIMNLSVVLGIIRFLNKNQTVNWERSKRATT